VFQAKPEESRIPRGIKKDQENREHLDRIAFTHHDAFSWRR
jgi:hypothetical protein